MLSIGPFTAPRHVLAPDDLRLAAHAFETALRSLDESTCPCSPHEARQVIARYIIEHALNGERNPVNLGQGALRHLEIAGLSWPSTAGPHTRSPSS